MKKHWIGKIFLFILAVVGFSALAGISVMLLWNWLMPMLFGLKMLTFWEALGLFALAKIIFGFGGKGGMGRGRHRGGPWAQRFKEKWANMSDEEREKFRKCGRRFDGWEKDEVANS